MDELNTHTHSHSHSGSSLSPGAEAGRRSPVQSGRSYSSYQKFIDHEAGHTEWSEMTLVGGAGRVTDGRGAGLTTRLVLCVYINVNVTECRPQREAP